MKETDLQSLTIKAVRLHGGAAHKLSNRFLVGVSDLLVKLPLLPAALLEVKYDERAKFDPAAPITPGVTPLQHKFLKDYHAAGMACGVLSFLKADGRLLAYIKPIQHYQLGDSFRAGEYWNMGTGADRLNYIHSIIKAFALGEEANGRFTKNA